MSRRIAFLTMSDPTGFVVYDQLAAPFLEELGWAVEDVPWDRPAVAWPEFAAVVIRSPWDYQRDVEAFLSVLQRIDRETCLLNSLDVVRWNIRKTYLRELAERRVPVVPTYWCEPLDGATLAAAQQRLSDRGAEEIVVKPVVGANADDTFRLRCDAGQHERQRVLDVFAGREAQVQPFLESIVEEGEHSLFYFDGEYSHAILKRPASGDFRVQEEHGGLIGSAHPDATLLATGESVMRAIPFATLYARVDLVRLPDGQLAVMEVELIEPSLYFPYDRESPARFARALDRRLRGGVGSGE